MGSNPRLESFNPTVCSLRYPLLIELVTTFNSWESHMSAPRLDGWSAGFGRFRGAYEGFWVWFEETKLSSSQSSKKSEKRRENSRVCFFSFSAFLSVSVGLSKSLYEYPCMILSKKVYWYVNKHPSPSLSLSSHTLKKFPLRIAHKFASTHPQGLRYPHETLR